MQLRPRSRKFAGMQDRQVITITAAVIIGVVLLILKGKLHPAISLVIGALTLGLATGMGWRTPPRP